MWQTGAGQPRWELETLAVRGERFAAVAVQTDYGNGMLRESINVIGLDATLSLLQRQVDFDHRRRRWSDRRTGSAAQPGRRELSETAPWALGTSTNAAVGEASLTGGSRHSWDAGRRVASVSDEPSNAASEFVRNAFAFFTERGSPSEEVVRAALTDDFAYEDRRSGPSFPDADAESFPKFVLSHLANRCWATTMGAPRLSPCGASGSPRWRSRSTTATGCCASPSTSLALMPP